MKMNLKVIFVLAMVSMFAACATSTPQVVQTAPCINLEEPVAAIPPEVKIIKINESVMFPYDSSKISSDEMTKIVAVAKLMKANADLDIYINAYASKEGPEDYNMALSGRRGAAVYDALIAMGIEPERISVTAKGETEEFGKTLEPNRRAVILNVE